MQTAILSKTPQWLIGLLLVQSCGTPKEKSVLAQDPIRISWPSEDQQGLADAEVAPLIINEASFLGSGRFNSIFWLDFEGATVTAAQSFIVKKAGLEQVVIPAFAAADIGSSEERESLKLNLVQNLLPLFPDVDIKLTTTKPLADIYSRVHIGASNFTGRSQVAGIAPLDLGNRTGNDILFVFPRELRNRGPVANIKRELTHVIAHEIGHALGARHINGEKALMRPSVALQADSFNVAGPVTETPDESENSLEVLLSTAGSRSSEFLEKRLPRILDLGAFASGAVIHYTVMTRKNFVGNPGIDLSRFRYVWSFEGKQSEGPSLLMSFPDKADHILELRVMDQDGASEVFQFSVGRRA